MVLLSFMYATGTRAQEVCDLTVKSVNFRSTGTTIDIVGKGSKARRIRIPDPVSYTHLNNDEEYLKINDTLEDILKKYEI